MLLLFGSSCKGRCRKFPELGFYRGSAIDILSNPVPGFVRISFIIGSISVLNNFITSLTVIVRIRANVLLRLKNNTIFSVVKACRVRLS